MRLFWILMLTIALPAIADRVLYRNFFPGLGFYFQEIKHTKCQDEYEGWLHNPECSSCPLNFPLAVANRPSLQLVNCLLENAEEFVKSNIAVASVLLGLLPTVLSLSGSTTTEVGLLASRRPLLAFLLAASSPSVYPLRALEFEDALETLKAENAPFKVAGAFSHLSPPLVSLLEYVFAAAAVANVATQIWALSVNSPSILDTDAVYIPLIWPLTSFILYLLGAIYVSLRVRLTSRRTSLKEKVVIELSPSASHIQSSATVQSESFLHGFLVWLASVLTIIHIVYGTIALSSLLFIAAADAVYIGLRLWASALVVRVILMYELSGVGHSLSL